jgi:nucleotide-binding universal stress UspA family protein
MKNILVLLNGKLTPEHVATAAVEVAKSTSSFLRAIFLNYSVDLAEYSYPFPNDLSLTRNRFTGKTLAEEDAELLEGNMKVFRDECEAAKIDFQIESDKEMSLGSLMEISAFSDLILADANENLKQYHIVDLLVNARCPVYLVSKHAEQIENVILTYDGTPSSMYAIKMYTYLFPELRDLPIYLVHVSENQHEFPKEKEVKAWLSKHHRNAQIQMLKGNIRDELVKFTETLPASLVVMGSFGRSHLSRFFHKSLAHYIIENGKSSLFITHK